LAIKEHSSARVRGESFHNAILLQASWPELELWNGQSGTTVREASNGGATFPAANVSVGIKLKIIKATD